MSGNKNNWCVAEAPDGSAHTFPLHADVAEGTQHKTLSFGHFVTNRNAPGCCLCAAGNCTQRIHKNVHGVTLVDHGVLLS